MYGCLSDPGIKLDTIRRPLESTSPVQNIQLLFNHIKTSRSEMPKSQTRKRHRPSYSCVECRRRKVRCDRSQPCNQCTAHDVSVACTYEEHPRSLSTRRQQQERQSTSEGSLSDKPTDKPTRIRGTVSKTRVFGHGHWMSSFSMVDLPPPCYVMPPPLLMIQDGRIITSTAIW